LARMKEVVRPDKTARGPGFKIKPSVKHVTVTAFNVGSQGFTHALTSIEGDTFLANKLTPFRSMRFVYKDKYDLPRHRVGEFVVNKYTYASNDSWWMLSSTVEDIEGNLRILRGIVDTGAYGAITFTFKHKIISQEAALDIAAHIADKGDKSGIYNASDFK